MIKKLKQEKVRLQTTIDEAESKIRSEFPISGIITDLRRVPLQGATVRVIKNALMIERKTDMFGYFSIDPKKDLGVELGDPIDIEIDKTGYLTATLCKTFTIGIFIGVSLEGK